MSVRTVQDTERLVAALKACGCRVVADRPQHITLEKEFTTRARLVIWADGEIGIFASDPAAFRAIKALLGEHDTGRKEVRR
jgi:hypothetical protein